MRFNQDGNLLGRIGALLSLAAVAVLLTRVGCVGGTCPMGAKGCCAGARHAAEASPEKK